MKEIRYNTRFLVQLSIFLIVLLTACGFALAYTQYSVSKDATNCRACHGDFRSSPYISLKDGQSWGDDLHDVHRNNMLTGECDTCHASGRFPVFLDSSNGGFTLDPISCIGCHGRAADATSGTSGTGVGLRQHHYRAGQTVCLSCHADSDPAAVTPVSEATLPPYYRTGDPNYPDMPSDPCNPNLTEEQYAASTLGLDNDGDNVYDMLDTDCSGVAATPGESSALALQPLLVTAFDSAGGTMTLSYESGCSSTDHNLEWGALGAVGTYGYNAQTADECGIGIGGTYVWSYPATPTDIFFLIVGNDGSAEGSLGLDSSAGERPENTGGICDFTQSLGDRCD
ncbi:MAG: hypothetical protein IFK94_05135 [Acidobacteria bacterium]|uniref:Uncharacterized protein n=1 Tax=Candidatus Polarisedimenticola svalbardensis TaxID=2886004 RepID=A0A8J6XWA1_9BACT|nr:hypothetical protein [Candidatus Polarisedimenticola svalbardensis]